MLPVKTALKKASGFFLDTITSHEKAPFPKRKCIQSADWTMGWPPEQFK